MISFAKCAVFFYRIYSVSEEMGYLKRKSSLIIFEKHINLKYKYGKCHFRCKEYYVDIVGKHDYNRKIYAESNKKNYGT